MGPFEILSRIEPVAYQLALPPYIRIHDVFYTYLLKKYFDDQSHIINWDNVQVEIEGEFPMKPMCILDKRKYSFRNILFYKLKYNGNIIQQKKLLGKEKIL